MPTPTRHPTTQTWAFPPERPTTLGGLARTNLREIVARPERFEHHLLVCASVGGAQLEVTAASEPLYFGHVNVSDEYAAALPTGDVVIDSFPLRTFLSDAHTGADVARYNHHAGDLVLHPFGFLHWPGRLRPPYEPFMFAPGLRRTALSLVYCASRPTPPAGRARNVPADRDGDAKSYVSPAPPMQLVSFDGAPGSIARVGNTSIELVVRPAAIAPPRGGWVVLLQTEGDGPHSTCDLVRLPQGAQLDGSGIVRALVFAGDTAPPDAEPEAWRGTPHPPFAPFEDAPRGALPIAVEGLSVEELSEGVVRVQVDDASKDASPLSTDVPRYWLARMLYRVVLHGLRLGYVETYGGLFVDDRRERVRLGVRAPGRCCAIEVDRRDAPALLDRLYRAVAPPGYAERLV